MRKKITDVAPPDGYKEAVEIKTQTAKKRKSFEEKEKRTDFLKNKKIFAVLIAASAVAIILAVFYLTTDYYSRLEIYLKPVTEGKIFEDEAEINVSQEAVDLENKIVPGKFFEATKEMTKVFETLGKEKEEVKSEGAIRVYNSFNPPRSIALRESTRFLSAEGSRIFRAPDKIYLPPAAVSEGKLTPSFADIKVLAEEGGEDYNIGPSKFSVPGLAGTAFYYSVWAESSASMAGGYKKEIAAVSEDDLKRAEIELKQNLLEESVSLIKTTQLPEGYLLNNDFLYIKDFLFSCLEKPGEKKAQFNCSGEISVKGIGVALQDLKKAVLRKITNEIGESKDADLNSLALDIYSKGIITENGKMLLGLKIGINVFEKISEQSVLLAISGLEKKAIKNVIAEEFSEIKEARLNFWPFWSRKAPKETERIKIFITP